LPASHGAKEESINDMKKVRVTAEKEAKTIDTGGRKGEKTVREELKTKLDGSTAVVDMTK